MMTQQDPLIAGRYRMGRLLGSGGFGAVYLATDERLHRPVAIKLCSTQRLPPHEAAEAAALFQSEALTLARLRHPGLTAIWDYFSEGNDWYLVMEYVPGESLRDRLRRTGGPLPQYEAIDYARQLCQVLGYLHAQFPPVVFRDLKPGNVMVTPDGQLKLIDFGIARLFSPGKAADTAQFGTPGYAPPEQYGGQTEPRSDLYSLGVVLHQMLTGHNPTSTPFALPPVRSLNTSIVEPLEQLVAHATAYDIEDRVASADEFCRQLDVATAPPRPAPRPPSQRIVTYAPAERHTTGASRQTWTPTPQRLPARPPASAGIVRVVTLLVLLGLLLASIGAGGWYLATHLDELRELASPTTVAQPPAGVTLPAAALFSALGADGRENIFQLSPQSGKTRQLTAMPVNSNASQPALSPDGSRIAYTRETREYDDATQTWSVSSEVRIMDRGGGGDRSLLPGTYGLSRSAAWSPDGKWVAVEAAESGREWHDHDIVLVAPGSGELRQLVASPRWEGGPAWSPDSRRVAFHGQRESACMEIYAASVDDGTIKRLTDHSGIKCGTDSKGDYWPDWSVSGIAFGRKIKGVERIVLLDPNTGATRELDTGSPPAGHPRWSEDGQHILFEQGKDAQVALARYDLATSTTTPLPTGLPGSHLADWN